MNVASIITEITTVSRTNIVLGTFAKYRVLLKPNAIEVKSARINFAQVDAGTTLLAPTVKHVSRDSAEVSEPLNYIVEKSLFNNISELNKYCDLDPCNGTALCGTCAECKVSNHRAHCVCPAGYIGDPTTSCTKPAPSCDGTCPCNFESHSCFTKCATNNDCSCGEVCKAGKCVTKCNNINTICPLVSIHT